MNNYDLFVCHRDYFLKEKFRQGGADDLLIRLFRKEIIALEISHGDFNKKVLFCIKKYDKENFLNSIILLKKEISINFKLFKYLIIIYHSILFFKLRKISFNNCLGADPVSVFIILILRNFLSIKFIFFHITDFSEKRFSNFFLNLIYKIIFKTSLKFSNIITSPSKKLIKLYKKRKIFFVPNSPFTLPKLLNYRKKNVILFLIPKIDSGINLELLFEALYILKKKLDDYKIIITGNFFNNNLRKNFSTLIKNKGLTKNIIFTGFLNNEKVINKLLLKAKIGIICYKKTSLHTYYDYSDSLKIRKYSAYGLPIISDNFTPTAREAKKNKCCLIYNNESTLAEYLFKLLTDKILWKKMSNNSIEWSKKNSKSLFINKILKRVEFI
jgi:glycosyltransferase involved in cell wall biosynthesis